MKVIRHRWTAREPLIGRTDETGVARVTIDRPGKWYVKFTNLVRADEPGLDYQSKWATLTFEVR